jgi:hypothetical protein
MVLSKSGISNPKSGLSSLSVIKALLMTFSSMPTPAKSSPVVMTGKLKFGKTLCNFCLI